jgi:hypothetical protein
MSLSDTSVKIVHPSTATREELDETDREVLKRLDAMRAHVEGDKTAAIDGCPITHLLLVTMLKRPDSTTRARMDVIGYHVGPKELVAMCQAIDTQLLRLSDGALALLIVPAITKQVVEHLIERAMDKADELERERSGLN